MLMTCRATDINILQNKIDKSIVNDESQLKCNLSNNIEDSIDNQLGLSEINSSLYKSYKEVLLSKKTFSFSFVVAEGEQEYYINDISYEEYRFIPEHFSFVDMNKDEVPEIVIEGTLGMAGFVLVLRQYDGRMIGHEFSHRQMSDIKNDGTYLASGGAAYNGYYYLSFNEDSYIQNNVVRMDTEEADGNYTQIYFRDEVRIEEEEFKTLWQLQQNKDKPEWIDFNFLQR